MAKWLLLVGACKLLSGRSGKTLDAAAGDTNSQALDFLEEVRYPPREKRCGRPPIKDTWQPVFRRRKTRVLRPQPELQYVFPEQENQGKFVQ